MTGIKKPWFLTLSLTALVSVAPLLGAQSDKLFGYGNGLQAARVQQVNIFGDGNPDNGPEDSRIDMSSPLWNAEARFSWNMSAGTIFCDGETRGSATIVDVAALGQPGEFSNPPGGVVLMSAAHVFYNLNTGRLYHSCDFHYMALDKLPGYQARIDLKKSQLGHFNPGDDRTRAGFGEEDWAIVFATGLIPGIEYTGGVSVKPFHSIRNTASSYQFIAYHSERNAMAISTTCEVLESKAEDIGGGGWAGHLLDDCDSLGGASGGGLIARVGNRHYLVGIRSGSHWDGERFPAKSFPDGPPAGTLWDVTNNTNFSRAIDEDLMARLQDFALSLNQKPLKFKGL